MKVRNKKDETKKILTFSIFLFILIFAFYFNFEAGRRGFFPFDQSIVFDGSYRILKGQIPYKDFLIPVGPVSFYIHSLFFKIFGINYTSFLLGSSFINLLATILSFFIIYLIFPSKKWLSFVGAFLTAIWFYPIFGTPYMEQTSFFISLWGILSLVLGLFSQKLPSFLKVFFIFLSGFFSFFSILSKQNAGFVILPVYFLLIISYNIPKIKRILTDLILFLGGFFISLLLFSLYLILFSDFGNFLKFTGAITLKMGVGKLLMIFTNPLLTLARTQPISFIPINSFFFLLLIFSLVLYFYNFSNIRDKGKNLLVASILCGYLMIFQSIYNITSHNEMEVGMPFTGIIFSLGVGIILTILEGMKIKMSLFYEGTELKLPSKRFIKMIFIIFLFSLGTFLAIYGMNVAIDRKAQNIFANSVFKEEFSIQELKGLKWAEPTIIHRGEIKASDVENIIHFLKRKRKNFFVFPDFTIFYGLLGSPSPQPILWFHKGLTFPSIYDKSLDEWITRDLKRKNVEIVVIEECSWFGTTERLNSFPLLKSFIKKNFRAIKKIGIFIIYEKIKTQRSFCKGCR